MSRYDRLSLQTYLTSNHFQPCRGPNRNSGSFHLERDVFIVCPDCGEYNCITCDTRIRFGTTCAQMAANQKAAAGAKASNKEEKASARYLKAKTKNCSHCRAPTVKRSVCDYMTCVWDTYRCSSIQGAELVNRFSLSPRVLLVRSS